MSAIGGTCCVAIFVSVTLCAVACLGAMFRDVADLYDERVRYVLIRNVMHLCDLTVTQSSVRNHDTKRRQLCAIVYYTPNPNHNEEKTAHLEKVKSKCGDIEEHSTCVQCSGLCQCNIR